MNTITYKKIIFISCILAIALGVFLHFAYDLSSNNPLVALIAPVNESVFEHLKILFIPFTLFSVGLYFFTKRKFSNLLLVTLFGNIVGMFTIVTMHYLYSMLFGDSSMIWDIFSYVVAMALSFVTLYLGIYNKDFIEETADSTVVGATTLALLFASIIIITVSPFKAHITMDPVTKTYGIPSIYTKYS